MLRMLGGPENVVRQRERIRDASEEGASTVDRSEL